jgi:hypothetical protein
MKEEVDGHVIPEDGTVHDKTVICSCNPIPHTQDDQQYYMHRNAQGKTMLDMN